MSEFGISNRKIMFTAVALAAVLTVACQRKEAPTPGVAGGTANPPAAVTSTPETVPAAPSSPGEGGTGKSPGMATPEGTTGSGTAMPAPTAEPTLPPASAVPTPPPADLPGTMAPSQPASAPKS